MVLMSIEFLDLTDLQRRGLLRKAEELARISRDGPEVLDLTDAKTVEALDSAPEVTRTMQPTPIAPHDSPMDFLSSFAQVGAQQPQEPSLPHATHSPGIEPKIDTILAKLEDTMFKLETVSSRLGQLEARFRNENERFK